MNLLELKEAVEKTFTDEFKLIELSNFVEKNKDKYIDLKYIFNESEILRNSKINEYKNTDLKFTIAEFESEYLNIFVEVFKVRKNSKNYICKLINIEVD